MRSHPRLSRKIIPQGFTFTGFSAIIGKDICYEEERLGNAPHSELEFGESPAGRAHRESPPSSEPKAFLPVGFAGNARYSAYEWTQHTCVNLGGTASAFVPWMKANYFLEESDHV